MDRRQHAVFQALHRTRWRDCQRDRAGSEVEAAFEQLEQRLAGDPALPISGLEVPTELVLEHPVDPLDALLLAQLQTVAEHLRLAGLAVLPWRKIALLDRALFRIAALSLEEELHAFAPAQPANRT